MSKYFFAFRSASIWFYFDGKYRLKSDFTHITPHTVVTSRAECSFNRGTFALYRLFFGTARCRRYSRINYLCYFRRLLQLPVKLFFFSPTMSSTVLSRPRKFNIINFIRIICDTRWKQRNASHIALHGKGHQMLITLSERFQQLWQELIKGRVKLALFVCAMQNDL